ncbi:XylR N-terminal domain-containing protein [Paenibacillus naphthalenovorans]|uniref:XylR N-terminal domain-containing protein n=1 Tax=Paenibacillus naphthalenovorans TaxID=162209 RepID=UPI003D28C11B
MRSADLKLNEFYKTSFDADPRYEKMISIPTSAIGTLRKELIETIGPERMKGFLMRYGWHCGVSDALKMKQLAWDDPAEALLAGPRMHILHGNLEEVIILQNDFDFEKKTMHMEALWRNSYEAKEHLEKFGKGGHPQCHTLVGYASGYLSTIIGEKVIVIEQSCQAMGNDCCFPICKTVKEWNGKADDVLKYYEPDSLINELDRMFEKLRIERDNLNRTYQVHEKLMNEVLREKDLSSIAKVLFQTTGIPVLIEDKHQTVLAMSGIEQHELAERQIKGLSGITRTECLSVKNTCYLVTPIFLQRNIVGYCYFLYDDGLPQEVDWMILERAAVTCSMYLLNERTRLIAEQRMKGSFLDEMISGHLCREEFMRRAQYFEFDVRPPFFMVTLHEKSKKLSSRYPLDFNDELVNSLYNFCRDRQINNLIADKSGKTALLFSETALTERGYTKRDVSKKIVECLQQKYPHLDFKAGVSSSSERLEEIGQLFEESLAALKITNPKSCVVHYDSLGIEGVLFQASNVNLIEKFVDKRLGKLIREDRHKDMELTKTLYHYVSNGCNVHKTSRKMNISISGLRYRLQRLNEILECDINRPAVTYQIYLALQSMIALGELDMNLELEEL